MFRIKICGITNISDAHLAARAGADAIGLNFFANSRRFVEPEVARQIAGSLPPGITKVGVFVNHTAEEIKSIAQHVGLDCVQLHGDEPATLIVKLPSELKIIRAIRCGNDGLAPAIDFSSELEEAIDDAAVKASNGCRAFLIDADAGTEYGGTGKRADWERIRSEEFLLCGIPLVLAGGLAPNNVADAIAAVGPDAVDVASGVESSPGIKDPDRVAQFVAAANAAFAKYPPRHW